MTGQIIKLQELETEGWLFKVGDAYSNPFEPSHFKITKITLGVGCNPEDAFIYGYRVHPQNHLKRIFDPIDDRNEEYHRAWYLNEMWGLETP